MARDLAELSILEIVSIAADAGRTAIGEAHAADLHTVGMIDGELVRVAPDGEVLPCDEAEAHRRRPRRGIRLVRPKVA